MNRNKLTRIATITAIIAGVSLLIAGVIGIASGMFESIAAGTFHIGQNGGADNANIDEKKCILAEGLVDSMAKGDFASATKDFDATMKAVLSAEQLGQSWAQTTARIGAFKSRTGSREAQEAGFQTVHVICQFDKASWDIKVTFDKDGKIGGLYGSPAK